MIELKESKKLLNFCNYLVLIFPICLVFSNFISEVVLLVLIVIFLINNSSISKIKLYLNLMSKLIIKFEMGNYEKSYEELYDKDIKEILNRIKSCSNFYS